MDIKMIAIDMDGTLLRDDVTISGRTLEAIKEAIARGIYVVPTTGRSYRNTRWVLSGIDNIPYFVNANGTVITDGKTEEILYIHVMKKNILGKVYELSKRYGAFFEVYAGQDAYVEQRGVDMLLNSSVLKEYCAQLLRTNIVLQDFRKEMKNVTEKACKIHIICNTVEDRKKLMEQIALLDDCYPLSTMSLNLEIVNGRWSKLDGIRKLAARLDIPNECIMAIGDSDNDYELLSGAGYSVAMGNANTSIKKISDEVTATNDWDGAAKAIEKVLR